MPVPSWCRFLGLASGVAIAFYKALILLPMAMRENPYRAPAPLAGDAIACRYFNQRRRRRWRMLGGIAVIAGGCLVLLAVQMWDLAVCERVELNGNVAYFMRCDRRPALLIGGVGAALCASGTALIACGSAGFRDRHRR